MRREASQFLRRFAALPLCVGLAVVSFAAAGGTSSGAQLKDPGAAVLKAARTHLGDTYTWGAAGDHTWDCSGFTSTLWREVGGVKAIPRTARDQQAWAVPIPKEQARPGDLVFFGNPVSHVGLIEARSAPGKHDVALRMIDASSSNAGVIERLVWSTGTVRFGRVPRKGMVKVLPWTPPALPPPAPAVVAPAAPVIAGPITPTAKGLKLLGGLPKSSRPGAKVPTRAARLAQGWLGNRAIGDVDLVRNVWHKAGGAVLPASRTGLEAKGTPVALKDAQVGDLVVYGPPGSHVGIYVGDGYMIDASRALRKVVLRKVWASSTVHLLRLPH